MYLMKNNFLKGDLIISFIYGVLSFLVEVLPQINNKCKRLQVLKMGYNIVNVNACITWM